MRRLPKKIGHGALHEGPPFGAVLFVGRERGRKIIRDAVGKTLAVGRNANDFRRARHERQAARRLGERREFVGNGSAAGVFAGL